MEHNFPIVAVGLDGKFGDQQVNDVLKRDVTYRQVHRSERDRSGVRAEFDGPDAAGEVQMSECYGTLAKRVPVVGEDFTAVEIEQVVAIGCRAHLVAVSPVLQPNNDVVMDEEEGHPTSAVPSAKQNGIVPGGKDERMGPSRGVVTSRHHRAVGDAGGRLPELVEERFDRLSRSLGG